MNCKNHQFKILARGGSRMVCQHCGKVVQRVLGVPVVIRNGGKPR